MFRNFWTNQKLELECLFKHSQTLCSLPSKTDVLRTPGPVQINCPKSSGETKCWTKICWSKTNVFFFFKMKRLLGSKKLCARTFCTGRISSKMDVNQPLPSCHNYFVFFMYFDMIKEDPYIYIPNCQAQSQLQLNWTELVLISISPIRPPAARPAGIVVKFLH